MRYHPAVWRAMAVAVAVVGCIGFLCAACKEKSEQTPLPEPVEAQKREVLSFGILPALPRLETASTFGKLFKSVNADLPYEIRTRSASSYNVYWKRLSTGRYDAALIQPFDYVLLPDGMYRPLVRFETDLEAVFVSLPGSPLQELGDLTGKTVAMPAARAAVSRLAVQALNTADVDIEQVKIRDLGNHAACLQAVLAKEADVCVTAQVALNRFQTQVETPFKTIGKSQAIPNVLIVAHERVPEEVVDKLSLALLAYDGLGVIPRFVPATSQEYDVVRDFVTVGGSVEETGSGSSNADAGVGR